MTNQQKQLIAMMRKQGISCARIGEAGWGFFARTVRNWHLPRLIVKAIREEPSKEAN